MKNIFELEDDIAELQKHIDVLKEDKKQLEKICWVREAERDEARQDARFYRDLYVGIVGKTLLSARFAVCAQLLKRRNRLPLIYGIAARR